MFAELIVNVCQTQEEGKPELCWEEVMLSTDTNPDFTWGVCLFGSQKVMAQLKETGKYAGPRFRFARALCVADKKYHLRSPA